MEAAACFEEAHALYESGGFAGPAFAAEKIDIAAIEATGRAIPNAILEIDAVLTRDGHLVLMHDETMERTTTGRGRVADLTLAQVKAARLKASNGALTDAAPPTLAEALDAAGRWVVNAESRAYRGWVLLLVLW